MRMQTLGGTGIKVSAYCLGAMMFGQWGNPDHDESIAIINAALEGGINFIDTADAYSGGESEEIVGKALHGRRDEVILATKVNFPMSPDPNTRGNSPLDRPRGREQPSAAAHRLHRPVPDPPAGPGYRHRGDPVRAVGPGAQR